MWWTRLAMSVGVGAALLTGCGAASAQDRELWWLVDTAESQVPLSVTKLEQILGTSLDPVTAYRWESGAVVLGPNLTVTDTATVDNIDSQEFTYFGIEVNRCVSLTEVIARYPSLVPKHMPSGHSDAEPRVYAAPRDWGGDLMFGFDQKTGCLQSFSLQSN